MATTSHFFRSQPKQEFRSKYRNSYDLPSQSYTSNSRYASSRSRSAEVGPRSTSTRRSRSAIGTDRARSYSSSSGPIYLGSEGGVKYHSTVGKHDVHLTAVRIPSDNLVDHTSSYSNYTSTRRQRDRSADRSKSNYFDYVPARRPRDSSADRISSYSTYVPKRPRDLSPRRAGSYSNYVPRRPRDLSPERVASYTEYVPRRRPRDVSTERAGSYTDYVPRKKPRDVSADRILSRSNRDSDIYINKTSAEVTGSKLHRPTQNHRRRYSFSLDNYYEREFQKEPSPTFESRPRYNEILERKKRRRELGDQLEQTYNADVRSAQDENIKEILKRARAEDYTGIDFRSTVDSSPERHRSQSLSRNYEIKKYEEPASLFPHHRTSRSASISRLCDENDNRYHTLKSKRSSSLTRYNSTSGEIDLPYRRTNLVTYGSHDIIPRSSSKELTPYGIIPAESTFEPDNVQYTVLPSGQRATTYTRTSQRGTGDQKDANVELERVIQRTQHMHQNMSTLEDFVRRNRQYFPEETYVYQQVRFFQLNEAELAQIGEPLDAVVYGVKIKEKLVVPPGTEVAHILKRYYDKDNIEIQYGDGRVQRKGGVTPVDDEVETTYKLKDSIRQQVEKEYEEREAAKLLKQQSYDAQSASEYISRRDKYQHIHPHISPEYIKSYYKDAGVGYESIYEKPRYKKQPIDKLADEIVDSGYVYHAAAPPGETRRKRYETPQFTTTLSSKRSMEGQTVQFHCTVGALPGEPDVTWMKGNHPISSGDRIKISNDHGLLSLEISDLTKDDAGVYTVKVINTEGEVACNATLEVQDSGLEPTPRDGRERPWFICEPQNTSAEIGQRATFEAQAIGRPAPTFKWQRDNITIQPNDRIKLFSDEQGNCKLIIQDIETRDSGLYFCIAENNVGKAKATATLRVAEKGQLPKRRSTSRETTPLAVKYDMNNKQESDKPVDGTAPWFIQTIPESLNVHEGDPLLLQCMVDGDPKPRVTWLKEPYRELQYSRRHRVVVDKEKHTLEVNSSLKQDAGRFIVIAKNKVGKITGSCWVNMMPPKEYDEHGVEIQTSYVTMPDYEYGMEVEMEPGKMAPKFVKKLPLEIEEKEGENIEVECRVTEADLPEHVKDVKFTKKVVKEGDIKTVKVGSKGEVTVTSATDSNKPKTEAEPDEAEISKPTEVTEKEPAEEDTLAPERSPGVQSSAPQSEQKPETDVPPSEEVAEPEIQPVISDRVKLPPPPAQDDTSLEKEQEIEVKEIDAAAPTDDTVEQDVKDDQEQVEEEEIKPVDKKKVESVQPNVSVDNEAGDKNVRDTVTEEVQVTSVKNKDVDEKAKKLLRRTSSIELTLVKPSSDEEPVESTEETVKDVAEEKVKEEMVESTKEEKVKEEVVEVTEEKVKEKTVELTEEKVKEEVVELTEEKVKEKEVELTEEKVKEEVVELIEEKVKEKEVELTEKKVKEKVVEVTEEKVKEKEVELTEEKVKEKEVEETEEKVKEEVVEVTEEKVKEKEVELTEEKVKKEVVESTEEKVKEEVVESTEEKVKEKVVESTEEKVKEEVVEISVETVKASTETNVDSPDGTAVSKIGTKQHSEDEEEISIPVKTEVSTEKEIALKAEVSEKIKVKVETEVIKNKKSESRAESVVSETVTDHEGEESWTEYSTSAYEDSAVDESGSEVNTEVEEVIEVKKVKKVKKVRDGEESVSKVTEITTKVTEGDQVKETVVRKEETGDEVKEIEGKISVQEVAATEVGMEVPEDATVTEVRTVTKVRKVIEVSPDGEETVVSTVTEKNTQVKEGDEVKETKEVKEEKGDVSGEIEGKISVQEVAATEVGMEVPEDATVTEVRTVTKVRKVIEVSADGEETVVSTVTEKNTQVKEGDEVKETKEVKEEKGDVSGEIEGKISVQEVAATEVGMEVPEDATVTEVRTVTKVRKVIEVSADGEETVVSTVTEKNTQVKEGDEVKETKEVKEEKGEGKEIEEKESASEVVTTEAAITVPNDTTQEIEGKISVQEVAVTEVGMEVPEDATVTEVRTVTKVRKVIEVSADGEETVVSTVTEKNTQVKEGDEVKETKEVKEEKGDVSGEIEIKETAQEVVATEAGIEIPEDATVTEVRTVTKVRKVIEVSPEGEETVVSTVTEKTTKVKEGDEVKETKEIKEEKGDAAEKSSSEDDSSSEDSSSEDESSSEDDSSSEDSSSEESSSSSSEEDSAKETGKGDSSQTADGEIGKGDSVHEEIIEETHQITQEEADEVGKGESVSFEVEIADTGNIELEETTVEKDVSEEVTLEFTMDDVSVEVEAEAEETFTFGATQEGSESSDSEEEQEQEKTEQEEKDETDATGKGESETHDEKADIAADTESKVIQAEGGQIESGGAEKGEAESVDVQKDDVEVVEQKKDESETQEGVKDESEGSESESDSSSGSETEDSDDDSSGSSEEE